MDDNLSDLTVVIVTFKTDRTILKNCLSSINNNVKIVIVENSKEFINKEEIEREYNNVKIICSGSNLGMGSGNNFGLKNTFTKYALILNPDIICDNSFFSNIQKYLKGNIDFSIIGTQYNDNSIYKPAGFFSSKKKNKEIDFKIQELTPVEWVVGCSFLINLKNFENKEIFDENFFLFFEEFDLCRRLNNNKLIFSSNKLIVNHLGFKGSFAFDKKYELEAIKLRNWHYLWSQFYFNKKHDGYFLAYWKGFFKIIPFFLKFIYFIFVNNALEKNKYKYRFLGLLNSMLLKKSKFRIDF
tara:strand:+ start:1189 stop:2082 length:894 start_codon:yes stop_codon:yes gene_type:complete